MEVTRINNITPDLETGDCYRDFVFSSTVVEQDGSEASKQYNIDITAPVFDATPELHLWAKSKPTHREVAEVTLFATDYVQETRSDQNETIYREVDTELRRIVVEPEDRFPEAVYSALQTLADWAYDCNRVEMPTQVGEQDE